MTLPELAIRRHVTTLMIIVSLVVLGGVALFRLPLAFLPTVDAPAMHVMVSYYLPAEGRYRGGWGKSAFSGPMRQVDEFTQLATGPQAQVVRRDAAAQAVQMEKQVQARVDAAARKAGATPIRVRLPINGKLYKFEKILALQRDPLWFEVIYSGWKPAK